MDSEKQKVPGIGFVGGYGAHLAQQAIESEQEEQGGDVHISEPARKPSEEKGAKGKA